MANRNFPQSRMWGFHLLPRVIDCHITVGAAGAVSSFSGPGVNAVTHDGTGIYKIQLQDNYASVYQLSGSAQGTVTGSAIDPNTATPGALYQITIVGTSNWVTAGIPAGITPAVGMRFALASAPIAGTGRVKLVAASQIAAIQPVGAEGTGMLQNQPFVAPNGGYVQLQCVAATGAGTTTLIAADPASGEVIHVLMHMNDSQVQ